MSSEAFFELFRRSAFRLETQPQYLGSSDAALRAFLAGHPLPLSERPAKVAWMRLVAAATAAGKRLSRVHVVELPLSDYMGYELSAYPENVDAGEDVRIADRGRHPALTNLRRDFWLLDDETAAASVLLLSYDSEGRFVGQEHTTDAAVIARCRRERDLALAASVPLDEFLTLAR